MPKKGVMEVVTKGQRPNKYTWILKGDMQTLFQNATIPEECEPSQDWCHRSFDTSKLYIRQPIEEPVTSGYSS
jgi:hypothetical protein